MNDAGVIVGMLLVVCLLIVTGCEPGPPAPPTSTAADPDPLLTYSSYAAVKIDIIPLTEFVSVTASDSASQLRAYVSMLDEFDCQIKSPGVFRFELYECVERSPQPKGKRLMIRPDIDLTDPEQNSGYWRDYLRAYRFNLDFTPVSGRSYILEATCSCPNGRRLSTNFTVKYPR